MHRAGSTECYCPVAVLVSPGCCHKEPEPAWPEATGVCSLGSGGGSQGGGRVVSKARRESALRLSPLQWLQQPGCSLPADTSLCACLCLHAVLFPVPLCLCPSSLLLQSTAAGLGPTLMSHVFVLTCSHLPRPRVQVRLRCRCLPLGLGTDGGHSAHHSGCHQLHPSGDSRGGRS